MNIEKMREEFELHYAEEFSAVRGYKPSPEEMVSMRDGDGYGSDRGYLNGYWKGWQASRAAIEVELPEIVCFEGAYNSIKTHEFVPRMIDIDDADEIFGLCRRIEAREAIESMGLKVKAP